MRDPVPLTRLDRLVSRNPTWPDNLRLAPGAAPHKVALLALAFFGGIAGLVLNTARSTAVTSAFTAVPGFVFYLGFALTSGVALYGVWKRGLDGLFIERAGLVGISSICAAYTVAVILSAGGRGLFASLFFVAFVVANIARINIINRDVLRVRRELAAMPDSSEGEQ